ncbi:hypothetical protein CVCC1112_3403 [Paenarthrobacter nicotinovorans]|nr:hypothetical protein CVCC1112_3403 [Paenarthrobacter nicotinovorans]
MGRCSAEAAATGDGASGRLLSPGLAAGKSTAGAADYY